MRLGSRETRFADTTCLAARLYGGAASIHERHRHRCVRYSNVWCLSTGYFYGVRACAVA
jgi:hypothetical protein